MDEHTVLSKRLNYQFKNPALLDTALTHRSANKNHYERMEFLGDAVLNMVITDELYHRFPHAAEGDLSRVRASLVKGETLSKLAIGLNLGDHLRLGSGELKSGGFRRNSILADVFESIIGAIYLDGGIERTKTFILAQFNERLIAVDITKNLKDPKTRLQEYLQARGCELPTYEITQIQGKAHNQIFDVTCQIELSDKITSGSGNSRRKAEQTAAKLMLEELDLL